jgi:putative transposase
MALRWTAAGMLEAAKGFRRLKAHKQLPILKAALLRHREANPTAGVDQTAAAA